MVKPIKQAMITVLAGLLLTANTAAAKQNYGATHGLILAGAIGATWYASDKLFPNNKRVGDVAVTLVALLGANYYYRRESRARKEAAFDEWYFDSAMDSTVPSAVSIFAISYRFK